jgi:Uma2 family endonuclease
MGETGVHVQVMLAILEILQRHFENDDKLAVHANLFLYYEEGNPKKVVCPDVFVSRGVNRNAWRRTYRVWQEGKGPDVVIEVTSKKTRKEDLGKKLELYRDVLRVREYFLFDPLEEYLEPSVQGFRLVEGRYEPIAPDPSGMISEVLGLRLERAEADLRFFDLARGQRIPTPGELASAARQVQAALEESEAARQDAEAAKRGETAARQKAEAEVQRLLAELEALRNRSQERNA